MGARLWTRADVLLRDSRVPGPRCRRGAGDGRRQARPMGQPSDAWRCAGRYGFLALGGLRGVDLRLRRALSGMQVVDGTQAPPQRLVVGVFVKSCDQL